MPTYEYLCKGCGERLEVQQSFTDDALRTCPSCSGELRKVFGNIAVTFKGSGFYKTDSRPAAGSSSSSESSSDTKGETKTETKSDTKADAKPETPKTETKKTESTSTTASTA